MKKNLNIKSLIFFGILIFTFFNCKEKDILKEELPKINKTSQNKINLIKKVGVDGFRIGNTIPEKLNKYKFLKTTRIVEEAIEEPIIIVISNKDTLLHISLEYDQKKGTYTDKISDILIKNKIYKTDKNIGIESTISDFIQKHNDYRLWYTYISGRFVIESKGENKIQYVLDANGYIGKKDLMAGDSVELDLKDFKMNTEIIEIRIF
jgi:hypothetical protein